MEEEGGCVGLGVLVLFVLAAFNDPWVREAVYTCIGGVVGLALVIALLVSLVRQPRVTVLVLSSPIWAPHWFVAWLILLLVRGYPVRWWAIRMNRERQTVQMWLRYIPSLIAAIWINMVALWLVAAWQWPIMVAIFFALASASLFIHLYYDIYTNSPPSSPDWPIFIGVEKELQLENRLTYIERKTNFKLWWARLWSS